MNILGMFADIIKNCRDNTALSDFKGKSLTYKDVARKIHYIHYIFSQYGIKKSDRIALLGCNSVNWAIVYMASITYGATIVPILPEFHSTDVQHILNHSETSLLFAAKELSASIDPSGVKTLNGVFVLRNYSCIYDKNSSRLNRIKKESEDFLNSNKDQAVNESKLLNNNINGDDIAAIVYTSGTTGFSKGVMLPYNSLLANIMFAQRIIKLEPGTKILSFLPLAHAFGCTFDFLFPFSLGCHITFLNKIPSPKVLIEAFKEVKPRLVFCVPLIIEKIYKKRIMPTLNKMSVRFLTKTIVGEKIINTIIRKKLFTLFGGNIYELIIGGAPLNPAVEAFLKKIGFPFTIGYGMTECGPLISYSKWKNHRLRAAGTAMDYLEVKIDSEESGDSKLGEITVRGKNVMKGYYNNPEATKKVLNKDGWLSTGDMGSIDNEGYVYIKGRHDNMILGTSGQNIYPEEIESKLNMLPFIQESLVMEKNGKLIARVYPDFETVDKQGLKEKDIAEMMEINRKKINEILPPYSTISKIFLNFQSFDKTPTKKIKRFLYY